MTYPNILSIPSDIWSQCLCYLATSDLVLASTRICRALSTDNVGDKAAWLALCSRAESVHRHMLSLSQEDAAPMPSESQSHRGHNGSISLDDRVRLSPGNVMAAVDDATKKLKEPTELRRYPSETWLGLYWLMSALAAEEAKAEATFAQPSPSDTAQEGGAVVTDANQDANTDQDGDETNDSNENDDDLSEETQQEPFHNPIITFWLLFNNPPLPPQTESLDYVVNAVASLLCRFVSGEEEQAVPSRHRIPSCPCQTRIIGSALRLGDAGHWDSASDLLRVVKGSDDRDESNQSHNNNNSNDNSVENNDAAIDAKICAATFLVDRLYAATYVWMDDNDSKDLISAVQMGREAVSQSLACLSQKEELSREAEEPDSGGTSGSPKEAASASVSNLAPPPPISSLFPTEKHRLASARLALTRALALLSQHVGLGATSLDRFDIRPMPRPDSDGARRSNVELFFLEGLDVIDSTLASMEVTDDAASLPSALTSMDLCELYAATVAARGELFFCAASANLSLSHSLRSGPILRDRPDEVYAEVTERLARKAIADMKHSFQYVCKQLIKMGLSPSIQRWCKSAPRSLLMLQARTAKDLGKACHFKCIIGRFTDTSSHHESNQYLQFAYAVSLRLHGSTHPSTTNILRLCDGHGESSELVLKIPEQRVNEWLISHFDDEFNT